MCLKTIEAILCTEPCVRPQVTIDVSSVGFVPLYGSSDKKKILALFSPSDPFTAVALYLLNQWWSVDDILKTADPAREGVVEVCGDVLPARNSSLTIILIREIMMYMKW